jgi:23S rRNA A1618 N6-methylase RlmF
MTLTEDDWKRMAQERADLLDALQKVTAIAARNESALVKMAEELRSANSAQNYWLGEYNKKSQTVRELETRINDLTSPLAELARSAKE